jgi:hypothetical protein
MRASSSSLRDGCVPVREVLLDPRTVLGRLEAGQNVTLRRLGACITLGIIVSTRTVRLDADAEAALQEIRAATGLPISEALKRGLRVLRDQVRHESRQRPYDIFRELDLGPGGYAIAPSTRVRDGVRRALAKKLRR